MAALTRCLGNFTKSCHSTTRPLYNLILRSLSTEVSTQIPNLQGVVDRFKNSCEDQKFRHRRDVYTRHVKRLEKAKQFDMIEDIIEHQKKFPDIQIEGFAIRLIALYGKSGMFEHARKLFDELPDLGCPRTVKSFSALLKSAFAAKEFHKVIELFNDTPSAISVEPDIFCHTTLIQALCEIGSVDEALSKLRELGKDANIVTYNTLLSALYKCDRISDAEKLWAEMEESETEVKPDAGSYHIRIKVMFSNKKVNEAVKLATKMANKGIKHDSNTYYNMIIGFIENENLEEAKKWYDKHQKSKCDRPLVNTYLVLIPACCEAGDFDKAFEIWCDAAKRKIFLHEVCKQVIDGLNKNGKTKKVSKMHKLMARPKK